MPMTHQAQALPLYIPSGIIFKLDPTTAGQAGWSMYAAAEAA